LVVVIVVAVGNIVVVVVGVKDLRGVIVELESDKGGIEVDPEHSRIHDFRILFNVDLERNQLICVNFFLGSHEIYDSEPQFSLLMLLEYFSTLNYRAFHRFEQTKFAYDGSLLGYSQFFTTAPAASKTDA